MNHKGKRNRQSSDKPSEWIVNESIELLPFLFKTLSNTGRNPSKRF